MNKWSKTIIPSSFVKEMRHSDKVKKVHIVILDKGKERTFQMSAAFTIPHVSCIHHTTCQPDSPYQKVCSKYHGKTLKIQLEKLVNENCWKNLTVCLQ